MNNPEDILINDLASIENLSMRAINICTDNSLSSILQILIFYNKYKTFLNLRNCGTNTNEELINICNKYSAYLDEDYSNSESDHKESFIESYNLLSPFHKSILNKHYEYLLSKLSVRSYNGLKNMEGTVDSKIIITTILSEKFKFSFLRNIGVKSLAELNVFKKEIVFFIEKLKIVPEHQLNKEYTRLILKTSFKDLPINFDEQYEKFIEENGKIKLFSLIRYFIDQIQIFSEAENRLFELLFCLDSENLSLSSIGKQFNRSMERMRQLKNRIKETIQNSFPFLENLNLNDIVKYNVDSLNSLNIIDLSLTAKINLNEETNFNSIFYFSIFEILLKTTHTGIGDREFIARPGKRLQKQNNKIYFLINSTIFSSFSFEKFIDDIYFRLSDKNNDTYSLNFKGYLYDFLLEDGKHFFEEIMIICSTILFIEFELIVNADGYITFEGRTKNKLHQLIYELLEENDKVLTVSEITKIINEKFLQKNVNPNNVRSFLNRHRELFIFFGRTSTYGLLKWETERDYVKGGTIRDLVENYLDKENLPKHISEVLNYIHPYRPDTNEKSIITNLKLDESNRFCFFSGDFVGLKSKKYPTTNYKKIIGSNLRTSVFIKMNHWDKAQIIYYFVKKYDYKAIQVESIINKKIVQGELKFTKNNKLII